MGRLSNIKMGDALNHRRTLVISLCAVFCLISILGSPFLYDHKNSGRYLLSVLKAADPQLFPGDPVVASLDRFGSAFYWGLGTLFHAGHLPVDDLPTLMGIFYWLSKIALVLLLLGIAWTLSEDYSSSVWSFILLAAWAAHAKGNPLGGEAFYYPTLRHTEAAQLLALSAILFALKKRNTLFWLAAGLSVLVHFLVGMQFLIVFGLPYLYTKRNSWKGQLPGLILLMFSLLTYWSYFSPPGFNPAEAKIFLQLKGDINHISLLSQAALGWVRTSSAVILSLLALEYVIRGNINKPQPNLTFFRSVILWGSLLGLLLSTMATFFLRREFYQLAQFQPMRIFSWVWFFTNLLLITITGKLIAGTRKNPSGMYAPVILIGVILAGILGSLWVYWLTLLGIIYFTFQIIIFRSTEGEAAAKRIQFQDRFDKSMQILLIITGIAVIIVIGFGDRLPYESLNNPALLLLGGLFLLVSGVPSLWQSYYPLVLGAVLLAILVIVSFNTHHYFQQRTDKNWDIVRQWARTHSQKSDLFINATGSGNFRVSALRSSIGEPESALAWVDPTGEKENARKNQVVWQGFSGNTWDVNYLNKIGAEWQAGFIIIDKPHHPSELVPVFSAGKYRIFQISD